MLHLLIVDDEPFIVSGMKLAVNWEKIGVSTVFTAYNAREAKEIFAREKIDIMLCDIEMPEESGLDLLAWVRENYKEVQSIILTAHADFAYARQAIQLGSLEYLLKPVPPEQLEQSIVKAINKVRKDSEIAEQSHSWTKNHPLFMERFWLDLVNMVIPPHPEAVKKVMLERKISYNENIEVLPVLIHVQRWHKPLSQRDEKILEYALKNVALEMIQGTGLNAQMVTVDRRKLLAVLSLSENHAYNEDSFKTVMESFIVSSRPYFYCDLACYIGNVTPIHEVSHHVEQLLALQNNNVAYDNQVFLLGGTPRSSGTFHMTDIDVWSVLLGKGAKNQLIAEAESYLDTLKSTGIDAQVMHLFHQNFLQIILSFLQERSIQAHQLYHDSLSAELSAQAVRSIPDMMTWIKHVVAKAIDQVHEVEESHSVVEKVRRFIIKNLDQELSREVLSGQFYLNPDYLDRLFKKDAGISMKEYLLNERLRVAEELLKKTELPVTEIAMQVGYSSLSAFTRLFKNRTQLNPSDYRRKYKSN